LSEAFPSVSARDGWGLRQHPGGVRVEAAKAVRNGGLTKIACSVRLRRCVVVLMQSLHVVKTANLANADESDDKNDIEEGGHRANGGGLCDSDAIHDSPRPFCMHVSLSTIFLYDCQALWNDGIARCQDSRAPEWDEQTLCLCCHLPMKECRYGVTRGGEPHRCVATCPLHRARFMFFFVFGQRSLKIHR
jgi:hypothetical protein